MRGTGRGTSPSFQSNQLGFVQSGLEALYTMDVERRNLLLYSEAFDNSVWSSASNPTVSANATTDPLGGTSADQLTVASDPAAERRDQVVTVPASTEKTLSVWVKLAGGANSGDVRLRADGSSNHELFITPTSEWVRYSLTVPASDTATSLTVRIYPSEFSVGSVGDSIYVWGAQLNLGSTALPYVPTTNKQALYDYSGNGRHATRGSSGSAFICPVGEKHLSLPGSGANTSSTPDAAALQIADDLDVRVRVSVDTYGGLIQKSGGAGSYGWGLRYVSGNLNFFVSDDGSNNTNVSASEAGVAEGGEGWVRATFESGEVTLYKSDDGVSWTSIGSGSTGSITSLNTPSVPLEAGVVLSSRVAGRIFRAQVYDGIDGTLVADFNPNRDAHGDVTRFTSSTTGEVWTINQASASDTNDPTWTGEGADFDGTDDVLARNQSWMSNTDDWTLTCVVKIDDGSATQVLVINGSDQNGYGLRTFSGTIRFLVAGIVVVDTGYSYPVSDWIHVAVRRLSGTWQLFVNGEKEGSTITNNPSAPDEFSSFGAVWDTGLSSYESFLDGGASQGGAYSRALSDAEVAQNYRAAKNLLAQRGVSI